MTTRELRMFTLINKAKEWIRESGESGTVERDWLEAEPPLSYDDNQYRVKLLVLEGSPPYGYILADYNEGICKAFKVHFYSSRTFKLKEVVS